MKLKRSQNTTEAANIEPSALPQIKKPFWKRKTTLIAASIVILFSLATAYFVNSDIFYGTASVPAEMRGLKVNNFDLREVTHTKYCIDGFVFTDFGSFFGFNKNFSFVIARVDSVDGSRGADITVLQNICGEALPQTMHVCQENHDEYYTFDKGTSPYLREGGVYLLPLDGSYVRADLNVLFEVDNKGRVWSHSDYKDFNTFDGQNVETLAAKIQSLSSNDDFLLANTLFWSNLKKYTMADVTINTETADSVYSFTINEILSQPPDPRYAKTKDSDGSKVIFQVSSMDIELGSRYLLFFYCDNGTTIVHPDMISKIQTDGTIKPVFGTDLGRHLNESVFTDYDGTNYSDIKEMASRVKPWIGTFPD